MINTTRLTLRPMTPTQLTLAQNNLEGALEEMGLTIAPLEREALQMRRQIYKAKIKLIRHTPEQWLFCTSWQMALAESLVVVGELGFKGPPVEGMLEIGYGTERKYRNRGYMKEAVAGLCRFGFSHPEISAILAYTTPENFTSQNVLNACGFVSMGREGKVSKFKLPRVQYGRMVE